jgi:hypothetical protein
MGEFTRVHLVVTPSDGNGANRGQIRFAKYSRRTYGFGTRLSGAVVVGEGWYDLR